MNNLSDQQLLRDYAELRSEEAFSELVRRYVDMVYSAALRTVCDRHQAEDVTQSTFMALARESGRLANRPILSSWLYSTSQHLAAKIVRSEVRRRAREKEALAMNELISADSEILWESIAPHFDKALAELCDSERDALLLRFFERKSAREIAQVLRISEVAAQKRVNRAIEHLRRIFARRSIAVGASGLIVVISANAVQAAPAGLATAVSSAVALGGAAIQTSTLIAATKTIAMTTIQKSLIAATVAVATGIGIYEAHRASELQDELHAIHQERDSLSEEARRLQAERDEATAALEAARNQIGLLRAAPAELLRLRADVAKLRGDAQAFADWKAAEAKDPMGTTAKSWLTRVDLLKKRAETTRDIPEFQLLTEKDWLDAVKDNPLQTDADFRRAFSSLRNGVKNLFGDMTRDALKKHAEANDGALPADWSQLKPYYDIPPDDAILQRYTLLQTGRLSDVPPDGFLFAEKAPPVDNEHDLRYEFRMNGTRTSGVNPINNAIEDAALQFATDHNGLLPTAPSQLTPYFKEPIDSAAVQKILNRIPPGVTTIDQLKAVGTLPR